MSVQSPPPGTFWSRRRVLGGMAAAGLMLPQLSRAENTTADGWTMIRVRPKEDAPTLQVNRGEELRVRLINEEEYATALHWYGVRLPNAMDGVPGTTQAPVLKGGSFDYRFTPPDAGTFWYGPPTVPGGLRFNGPSGALIVSESEPVAVDRDQLLFIGAIPEPNQLVTIPGRTGERLRLRLINAVARTAAALRLEGHKVWVMAIDGQPAEPFVARDSRVVMGPGNRIDLFVDLDRPPGTVAPIIADLGSGAAPLGRIAYSEEAPLRTGALPDPKPLPANPLPERMDLRNALRADLQLGGLASLETFGSGRPLFSAKRGRTVVLALINRDAPACALHVHGHHVRLLDNLDDGWKPFWLDSIMVPGKQTSRVAFVADNPGKWLLEAQTIGRSEAFQVTWFEVS